MIKKVLNSNKPMLTLSMLVLHVAIGFIIAQSPLAAKLWCIAILLIGFVKIGKNKNRNEEALLWSAYIAAADVPLRACEGALVWEIGKLGVVLFLLFGMFVSKGQKSKVPREAIIMTLLLIPGILTTFTWSNDVLSSLTFNLSGMACLLISMIYLYKKRISFDTIKSFFTYSLFPIVTLSFVLFYRTPSLETIEFMSAANFATSGGFGPNQVATILGYGWLIVLLMIYMKEKVTFNIAVTYGLLMFLIYRSLFTFSRGGNLAAILAFACFFFFYSFARSVKGKSSKSIAGLALVGLLGIGVVQSLDTATGGVFSNRFTGKNTQGEMKEDVTSGRADILKMEYELFEDNPMGVGVGGSRYFRTVQFGNVQASHNEFGRLLSEHGVFGIGVILILLLSPLFFINKLPEAKNKAFCLMFYVLCVASMMHSGCRTAMPELLYGLSFFYLITKHEDRQYRK